MTLRNPRTAPELRSQPLLTRVFPLWPGRSVHRSDDGASFESD